jgi:hypothetical protein
MNTDTFNNMMYNLPIELGNKIFNYLMPSIGEHRKKMKLLMFELLSIQEKLKEGNFLRDERGNYESYYSSQEYQDDLYEDWLDAKKYDKYDY